MVGVKAQYYYPQPSQPLSVQGPPAPPPPPPRPPTTPVPVRTTNRGPTQPSRDYLPPSTTRAPPRPASSAGYSYEVPKNPLTPTTNRVPITTTRRPVPTTTPRRPVTQAVVNEEHHHHDVPFWDFRESIPGEPEIDYPILDKIPTTSFKCSGRVAGIKLSLTFSDQSILQQKVQDNFKM